MSAQIVILHKKGFLKGRFAKTCPVTIRLFIKQLLDFKSLDFTMTKKGVKGQEKQAFVMTLIRRIAVKFPTSSSKKIRAALLLKGIDIHCTTVCRHLVYDFNQKTFKPAKKLNLSHEGEEVGLCQAI